MNRWKRVESFRPPGVHSGMLRPMDLPMPSSLRIIETPFRKMSGGPRCLRNSSRREAADLAGSSRIPVARLRAIEELTRPLLDFAQAAFLRLAAVLPLSSTYSQPILDPALLAAVSGQNRGDNV